MENDEVIIDLRVLIWEVLRKWHIIALVCIICAVLFGTFSVYRNNVANKEVPIEDLYEELEPAEITKVHNLVSVQDRIDEKAEYAEDSIYMSMNPYDVYATRIDFMFNKNPDNKYIRQMYMSYMFDGELYNEIAKQYSGKIEVKYISELIGYMSNGGRTNINDDSEENYEQGNDLNRLISVRIIGETEEQCIELQSLFCKNVKLYEKEIQKKYSNHSLEQTLSKAYHTTDGGVSSAKSSYDSQIVALYNEYQTLYNTLDEDQIALYDELVNPEKIGKEKKEEGLSLKYVAIGILFGGFIAVVVIVLLTMSNGKIFVQRQITNRELARVFGTYGRNKNNTARLILGDIGTDKPSQLDIIVAKVSVYCKKKGFTELTIIDDCATDSGKSQMKHVIDSIEKGGIQCNKITLSEGDTKYTELCGKNNILVIEELGKGTLKELEYMFMQLKDLESEVSGIICVQ